LRSGIARVPGRAGPQQRRERPSIFAAVAIWVLIVIMIVPDGLYYGAFGAMPTEGSPTSRMIWLSLLAFGIVVPLSRSGMALKLFRQINPFFLLFVALAAASMLWSIDPGVTLRRLVRVTTMLLDAVAFTLLTWHTTRFQGVLRPILTLMLIGSIIFVIAAPELAIEQADAMALLGAWHGLATQKNGLGSLAAIALILWLHGLLSKETKWWLAGAGAGISLTCLIGSRSSSSIMGAAFACPLMLVMLRPPAGLRRYLPYMVVLFVAILLVYSLAVLNLLPGSSVLLSPITTLTGKDLTFSGRTAIWQILNEHIALSPLVGSGYGAYWVLLPWSPSMIMKSRLFFYPTEGHNGYLDVINDLGIVGAVCLLGYLISYLRQGLRLLAGVRPQGILYLTLLFEQLVANLTESRWFNVLTCEFTIMTIATVAMGRTLLDLHMQRQSAAAARAASSPRAAPGRRVLGTRRTV
jgi:exopolysaccharide production protein ExoQ